MSLRKGGRGLLGRGLVKRDTLDCKIISPLILILYSNMWECFRNKASFHGVSDACGILVLFHNAINNVAYSGFALLAFLKRSKVIDR